MKRRATTETRIEHIARMMRRNQWRRGESGPELAAEWGVSKSSVEKYAAAASKRVLAEVSDPDAVRLLSLSTLTEIARDALAAGDRRNAIRAVESLARLGGVVPPTRHDIRAGVTGEVRIVPFVVELPEEIPDSHPDVIAASRAVEPRRQPAAPLRVELPAEIPDGHTALLAPGRRSHTNGTAAH